jgi:thymidylate kinase
MRFALTGSHGVGKTSIISELDDWLSNKGISCIYNSSNARKVKKSGMAINDEGDDTVQTIIAASHISHFSEDNWFADRCLLDCYAYGKHLFRQDKVSNECNRTLSKLTYKFLQSYKKIFYVPIEFDMVKDGVRKEDKVFQTEIDLIIKNYLDNLEINYVTVTGSVEERCEQIKNVIQNLL